VSGKGAQGAVLDEKGEDVRCDAVRGNASERTKEGRGNE
jgi:hypothetical protein